jgi:hypothetical protein
MTSRAKRDNPERESVEVADEAQQEEGVRRLARHFLTTPPQPKKAAPKDDLKREKPAKRRKG